MPDRASGCACCGEQGCEAASIGFTPTREIDRQSHGNWQADTVYSAGARFFQTSVSDFNLYVWEVPSSLTSGSVWDLTEQARYTQIKRADIYDETDEWDLVGTGWASLTDDEISDMVFNGRLGQDMGYFSKGNVLPTTIERWWCTFNYDIRVKPVPSSTGVGTLFSGSTFGQVSDGSVFPAVPFAATISNASNSEEVTVTFIDAGSGIFSFNPAVVNSYPTPWTLAVSGDFDDDRRIESYASLDVTTDPTDRSNYTINSGFLQDQEWISESEDPIGTNVQIDLSGGAEETIRHRIKTETKRIGSVSTTTLDTNYQVLNPNKVLSRAVHLSRGTLTGTVTPGVNTLASLGPGALRNYDYIATAAGLIEESSLSGTGLTVAAGDAIRLKDESQSTVAAGWEVIPQASFVLLDVLNTTAAYMDPDPSVEVSGRKVGIYVSSGGTPDSGKTSQQTPEIESFTGAITERTKSPTQMECRPSQTVGNICSATVEHALFVAALPLVANQATMNTYVQNNVMTGTEYLRLVDCGVTIRRIGLYEFQFTRVGATVSRTPANPGGVPGFNNYADAWAETITVTLTKNHGFETVLKSFGEFRGFETNEKAGTVGDPDQPFTDQELIDAYTGLYYASLLPSRPVLASGEVESIVLTESFDCSGFAQLGTYATGLADLIGLTWTAASV